VETVSVPLDVTTRDADGRTPLHWAAYYGYANTVRKMLQQQAEVEARDHQQRTPGHWCAFKGHLAVVKLLVEAGADVNARDAEGRTWLKMAVIGQQADVENFIRMRGGQL
jgi:ankyrin repeat protein